MKLMKRLFLVLLCSILTAAPLARANTSVPVLRIKDTIHVGTASVLERLIKEAKESKAPAVVIELDTPGGFLEATRDIVQLFLNTDSPRIIVWVTPAGARATSAGSMIAMASHYAAMASSTSIGAATPVSGGGEEIGKDMKAKITNDTLSFVEGIAQKRNRNVTWARDSVSSAASLSAAEALKKNVIDGIHETQNELWIGARSRFPELPEQVQFVPFEPSLKEQVLSFISNPNVAYGLMALGVLGIYMEISNPGTFIPGAIGALSLALGAITMKIIPIRPGALLLLVVGLVLLIIEIFTPLPTYGVAGVLGVAALFLSGLFLLDSTQTNLTLDAALWIPIFVVVVGFMVWLGLASVRSLRNNSYKQGFEALMGEEAVVVKPTGPGHASVRIKGELWSAQWIEGHPSRDFVAGELVKVVEHKGFVVYVSAQS